MKLSKSISTISIIILIPFFCFSQNIWLTSQSDVDSFDPLTTTITGSLGISGHSIYDLSNLSNLTSIGGNLYIGRNMSLTNLDGLSSLISIGGNLTFQSSMDLENIDGLSNLTSIGGDISINWVIQIPDIDAFSNLTTISGDLIIYRAGINNIDGLSNLTTILGEFRISSCNGLMNIDALVNVSVIEGDLAIRYNEKLTNCCGIQHLLETPGSVSGTIDITNNPSECSSQQEIIEADCTVDTEDVYDLHSYINFEDYSDRFQLSINDEFQFPAKWHLISPNGELIKSGRINNDQVIEILKYDMLPGMYFFSAEVQGRLWTKKLVILH